MAMSWAEKAKAAASKPSPQPLAVTKNQDEENPTLTAAAASSAPAPAAAHAIPGRKVVLDSGAIIKGGRVERLGDVFWTIKEVIGEIRDSNARMTLDTLPFELQVREVDPAALSFVTNFSKLTGDFPKLSAVDLKVMALTYQIEKEFNGVAHLNEKPRPPKTSAPKNPNQDDIKEEDFADNGEVLEEQDQPKANGESSAAPDTEIGNEEFIDPSEFERLPLADTSGFEEVRSRNGDERSSVVSTRSSSEKKKKPRHNLPGWFDGEEADKGWITPENIAEMSGQGTEEREAEDQRVACATVDFAMQNVMLQIGLRVLNIDGMVVKQVKQFVLKCHGCFKICNDVTKTFCPSCGNATLMRVSKWVQADGTITYSKGIKNFSTRGTKYTLPLPVQGRGKDDLVLREDQIAMSRHRQVRWQLLLARASWSPSIEVIDSDSNDLSQRKAKAVTDDDGFTTYTNVGKNERKMDHSRPQEIIGLGYSGGGKRNPNERRKGGRR